MRQLREDGLSVLVIGLEDGQKGPRDFIVSSGPPAGAGSIGMPARPAHQALTVVILGPVSAMLAKRLRCNTGACAVESR